MARGAVTERVRNLSIELMGEEITVRGLRLLPYLFTKLLDNQDLDPNRMNSEERDILMKWKAKGYISGMSSDYSVSTEFYDIMCKLLKVGYAEDMIYTLPDYGPF